MKQAKIIPRGKWVLVKPIDEESKENEFGLLIPAKEEKEKKAQGIVEAVGNEAKDIKKGDTVIYGVYAGESISMSNKDATKKPVEYKLLYDEDIIGFLI